MDDISIFQDKAITPTNQDLANVLGATYYLWMNLRDFVLERYPGGKEEWNYPGKKYGWSFRIKDKKRAILYFLPRQDYFKVAFVFGQKAMDVILVSNIDDEIKEELKNARKYAEGRGVRIDITDEAKIPDIKTLVDIKLAH